MSFDKFRVLMWKNWTLQKRRPIGAAVQVLFPIIIVLLVTWARNSFGNQYGLLTETEEQYTDIDLKNYSLCTYDDIEGISYPLENIHFAPNNEAYSTLLRGAYERLNFTVIGHANRSEMMNAFYSNNEHHVAIDLTSDFEVSNRTLSDVT